MRVQIDYTDGRFSMMEYTDGHEKAGIIPVTIDDADWREYLAHRAADAEWQTFILDLDNERQEANR